MKGGALSASLWLWHSPCSIVQKTILQRDRPKQQSPVLFCPVPLSLQRTLLQVVLNALAACSRLLYLRSLNKEAFKNISHFGSLTDLRFATVFAETDLEPYNCFSPLFPHQAQDRVCVCNAGFGVLPESALLKQTLSCILRNQ